MTYSGIAWQKVEIPFGIGLNQKTDDRARPQPFLDRAVDVSFDKALGLQLRLPYAVAVGSIFGGGTIANPRRIVAYGNELVLFTKDTVYSWNAQQSAWVSRGTHLAVKVTEEPRFATTGDQIDGDRAELSGTIVVAWTEGAQVYAAALDKTTGSVLVSPTAVSTAIGRPRLVALATKILLFVEATATLLTVRAIDPATPGTAISGAGATVLTTDFNLYYDVVRAGTQDLVVGACRRVTTTSYTAFTVTPALAVTTSTKARTCDGPIAVSAIPDGTQTQIARANGTNIQGDLLTTSTLADVFTAQAIGTAASTPVNQIAAAHRSVQDSGAFRCYVFWHAVESAAASTWVSKSNWVDNANALGAQANFVRHLAVASRAFDYSGRVFVWLAFAGATTVNATGAFPIPPIAAQNSYFLYRDDAFLSAKSVATTAGGFPASVGSLPSVVATATATYSWCATKRRRIQLDADGVSFAAREPIDVAFAFDSNEARRTAALGRTLYISGGEILQYDGVRLTELGFHVYPWVLSLLDSALGGSVAAGSYAYKVTWRVPNAQGESERSTSAVVGTVAVTGNSVQLVSSFAPLTATHKTAVPPAVEVWRSPVNSDRDADFFLASSNDPTALTNPNRYLPNDPTAAAIPTFNDFFADATLTGKEADPENLGVLEDLSAPAASILIATDTRLFLAGVAGDPHRIWYSKQRQEGHLAAFHEVLTVDVPRPGGDITSIAFLDETLFAFRQTAIYALPGVGLDNFGAGQQFGPARIVSLDVGAVSHESVALTPMGLFFKSSKGWYMLHGNGGLEFIGDKVADYDAETVLAINVVENKHEVRILSASRLLFWDYRLNQWGERTIVDGVHACIYQGAHVYLAATGTRTEQTTYTGVDYGMDVETAWIKLAGLHGASRCRKLQPLGEYRSAFKLRFRLSYNYDLTVVDDKSWTPSPTTVGGPLQVTHGPARPQCEAIKLRLTAENSDGTHTAPIGEALRLTSLGLEIGAEPGLWRRLPAAQQQ